MSERTERMLAAFHRALEEHDAAARDRILVAASGGDATMLAELRAMVAAKPPADFLADAPPQETPQQLGEFELQRVLAEGGCGVVWLARQASLQRTVAVKVMTAGPGTPKSLLERFHREPLAASRLQHPNIVPVLAEGQQGDSHWFAMQLVDGHSIAREIELQRRRHPSDPPLLLPRFASGEWFAAVARLCADAADALHQAHQAKIVHRDVKPHNLLLDASARVLVADFGIARDERFGSLTEPGTVAGSWHYMSPEQARVERSPVDHRTDIYSLGVVLYELLTLERPYEGETSQEIVDQIRRAPPRHVSQRNRRVPRDLETICMAAIARRPQDRYQTAAELRDDLRRFCTHEAILRQPAGQLARLQQWLHRRRRSVGIAATGVVTLLLGFGVGSGVVAASERSALAQRCEQLVAMASLGAASEATLVALWRDLAAAPATPLFDRARQRLREHREQMLAQGQAEIDSNRPDESDDQRAARVLRGAEQLWRAAALDSLSEALAIIRENPFLSAQEVSVVDREGRPVRATVLVRRLDGLTGLVEAEYPLGQTPLARVRLPAGLYRFVVTTATLDQREFSRVIEPLDRRPVELRLFPIADVTAGMVQIPAGTLHRETDGPPSGLAGKAVAVPSFWIDATEVTVGDFRAFCSATGHRPPFGFDRLDATFDRHPVVNVDWDDANAYAAWRGKRLPSLPEWTLAARGPGPQHRLFPWTRPGPFGNCNAPLDPPGPDDALDRLARYMRHATPVDAASDSCTPEGAYELFGNVAEWTESLGVNREDGRLVPLRFYRVVAGHSWSVLQTMPEATLRHTALCNRTFADARHGFRCAITARP